jgi:hypothetical protein
MNNNTRYKSCAIIRGKVTLQVWIPENYALVGTIINYEGTVDWNNLWIVDTVTHDRVLTRAEIQKICAKEAV